MSAPQIPNLLSLRGVGRSRGTGRGRGQARGGRGGPMLPPGPEVATHSQVDTLIQQTDNDASVSRLSAVNTGYFNDNYAHSFVRAKTAQRIPIINRGTYVRTQTIDTLVDLFLFSNRMQDSQIISLGAGTDTRYWRLRDKHPNQRFLYHEIDFPAVSENKIAAIRYSQKLSPIGSGFYLLHDPPYSIDAKKDSWGFFLNTPTNTNGYLFHPIDLRKMPSTIEGLLQGNVPTLLISECCLCYLSPDDAQSVIQTFSNLIPNLGIAIYEPTKAGSEFGKVMVQNLAMRGLSMPTLQKYPTLESQLIRLTEAGFLDAQRGADVLWIWNTCMSDHEKERIANLEMVDEVEEWELLASHYVVVWGWREQGSQGHFKDMAGFHGQMNWPEPPQQTGKTGEDANVEA